MVTHCSSERGGGGGFMSDCHGCVNFMSVNV